MASSNDDDPKKKTKEDATTTEEEADTKSGSTTILKAGTVEARGIGSLTSRAVHGDIQAFLDGIGSFSIVAEVRAFFTVWMFITRLPGPVFVDHHPGYLMRGMAYFPLAGLCVGIFVSVFFDAASTLLLGMPPIVAACASTAASFYLTGCFHEDGLADASDGIGGGWTRKQILVIMTDTRLGTYGCAVLFLYSMAKLELLAALGPSEFNFNFNFNFDFVTTSSSQGGGPALLASHCIARCTAPYMIRTNDYVDEFGPKYQFYAFMVHAKHLVSWSRVAFAFATGFTVAAVLYNAVIATLLMTAMLIFAHFAGRYGNQLLGGVMGDYLGAIICLTELIVLTLIVSAQNMNLDVSTVRDLFDTPDWKQSALNYLQYVLLRIQTMDIIFTNDALGVTLRFAAVLLLTKVWCENVGHRAIRMKDTVVQESKVEEVENNSITKVDTATVRGTFEERYTDARVYLDSLAKPVGSLGTLEDWAARLVALQCNNKPLTLGKAACLIFAGDHGAAAPPSDGKDENSNTTGGEGCSAYPPIVTQSILMGLERQIAGASVLGKQSQVDVQVLDVGVAGGYTAADTNKIVKSSRHKVVGGTKNFCQQAAMTMEEVKRCIFMGRQALKQYQADNKETSKDGPVVVALGEVGIGNTTSSAALIAALTDTEPRLVCGGGATTARTADPAVITKKIGIVERALQKHRFSAILPYQQRHGQMDDNRQGGNPLVLDVLAALGGCEIAAMVGCILEASDQEAYHNTGIPILVDGFIVTTAALVAAHLEPRTCRVMFLATKSVEPGQAIAIESIQAVAEKHGIVVPARPALDMGLRLGEGSGAILSVSILRNAVAVWNNMATLKDILEG